MNFGELVSLFTAQGFDYLQTSEAETYLNASYQVDICGDEDWPFLEEVTTGTAPLTLSEVSSIDYVLNTGQGTKLTPLDPRSLSDWSPTMVVEGQPLYYYSTGGNVLNVYPLSTTEALQVRYFKAAAKMSGTAVPIFPERFHTLIVDGAVARAYENSDDYELSQSAEAKFETRLQKMREQLLNVYRDGPDDFVAVTDPLAF